VSKRASKGLDRRQFLAALALPAAASLLPGCHGGQGDEPVHAPVIRAVSPDAEDPDSLPPPVRAVREFRLPPLTSPAIVFRARPPEPS
jgi:hypothetical protein